MARVMCMDPLTGVANILQKLGLLSSDKFKSEQIMKIALHASAFSLIMAVNVVNAMKAIKIGSGMELNRVTCVIIPFTQLFCKGLTLIINKKHILWILDDLKSDIFNGHDMKLNLHIAIVYKVSGIIRKYYIFAIGSFVFATSILPFVSNMRLMIPPPFDMGRYIFFYKIFHFLTALYLTLNSISFDVMYMSLMALCIAQLNILQEELINIFAESRVVNHMVTENEYNTKRNITAEQRILKQCIILHERINIFVHNLNMLLSLPLLVQYVCGCFVICNSILLLTIMGERNTVNIISIVVYSVITFSQMAVYHWLGNEINFKSSNVMDACYLSAWYKLNISSQKSLLTLMERTKRPFDIHLYKLVFISLKSLGEVGRWAYSLFALIKARYN